MNKVFEAMPHSDEEEDKQPQQPLYASLDSQLEQIVRQQPLSETQLFHNTDRYNTASSLAWNDPRRRSFSGQDELHSFKTSYDNTCIVTDTPLHVAKKMTTNIARNTRKSLSTHIFVKSFSDKALFYFSLTGAGLVADEVNTKLHSTNPTHSNSYSAKAKATGVALRTIALTVGETAYQVAKDVRKSCGKHGQIQSENQSEENGAKKL